MFDSRFERIATKALSFGIPSGHYRVPFVERLAPRLPDFGPGRIFIEDLGRRDVSSLVADEKAEITLDDRFRIDRRVANIGGLGGSKGATIHGGGKTLRFSIAHANFQPLTEPERGIRIHNISLAKMMDFLEPRLRCSQLIILTIC